MILKFYFDSLKKSLFFLSFYKFFLEKWRLYIKLVN